MSNQTQAASAGGISFAGALAILFIGLKLADLIHWSWLWVLAPLWGGLALLLVVAIVACLCIVLSFFLIHWHERKAASGRRP